MTFSIQDHEYMAHAIQIAKQGFYTTSPNPNVGCVVVKDDKIIAEGWHKKAGTGHAEVNAFAQLSEQQAKGATAYVTLEPCSHFGRTPPCAALLIKSKVARVVIGMTDPNPSVAGNGIRMLEEAGIKVEQGLLEQDARALNPGFLSRMERKRPYVQLKLASSLDGKTALHNGESKWITGPSARADVQKYRALSCAIISTAKTVLRDDAALNVRNEDLTFDYPIDDINQEIRQPKRIILDSQNSITAEHVKTLRLFASSSEVILIRKQSADDPISNDLQGIENIKQAQIKYDDGFDLNELLAFAAQQEINTLWVEAGATLASSFIEQSLYDELICYLAPKIMGKNAQEMLPIGPLEHMSQVTELNLHKVTQLGNDLKLIYTK